MKKILIADDDENVRFLFSDMLGEAGFEIHTAVDGLQALKSLQDEKFDLVMTDIRMPEVNGQTLITCLRTMYQKVPVIIVSGFKDHGETLGKNIRAILLKPVDLDNLLKVVNEILNEKHN